MIADLHIHTEFSCDSDVDMEMYVKMAIEQNVDVVCFTDHVDLNKNDYGYQYYDSDKYFVRLNQIKEKYNHAVRILSGIEFGEPHLY